MKNDIIRGNVYWVDFSKVFPQENHYQLGTRLAIVVSNNYNNNNCSNIVIIPCTTKKDYLPQHLCVILNNKINYLLPEMITTLDKKYLGGFYCKVRKDKFWAVEKAMQIQLGLYKGGNCE